MTKRVCVDLEKQVLRDCFKDLQSSSNTAILASLFLFKLTAKEDVKSLINSLVSCHVYAGSGTESVLIDINSASLVLNSVSKVVFWRREIIKYPSPSSF